MTSCWILHMLTWDVDGASAYEALPWDPQAGVEIHWAGEAYVRRDIDFRCSPV